MIIGTTSKNIRSHSPPLITVNIITLYRKKSLESSNSNVFRA